MKSVFQIVFGIIKSILKSLIRAIYNGRYFYHVEFYNVNNIMIGKSTSIERGTRLAARNIIIKFPNIFIGDNCWIGRDVEIQTEYQSQIILGDNVSIQDRCKIIGDVFIGQDSLLAPEVFMSSGDHYFSYNPYLLIKKQDSIVVANSLDFFKISKRISIGEDCWIGKNVVIMGGVSIGRGSVIAANSFVNKNIPPYEIWGGTPAKIIKERIKFIPPLILEGNIESCLPYFYFGFDHNNIQNNGIYSTKHSLCLLEHVIYKKLELYILLEMLEIGILEIRYNNQLLFDEEIQIGKLEKSISFDFVNATSEDKFINDLLKPIEKCSFLEFKFKSKSNSKKSFLLIKTSIIC